MGNFIRKTGTITIDIYSATNEHNSVQSFAREVRYDGKTIFKDEVKPSTHLNGNDLLSKFIRRADYESKSKLLEAQQKTFDRNRLADLQANFAEQRRQIASLVGQNVEDMQAEKRGVKTKNTVFRGLQ